MTACLAESLAWIGLPAEVNSALTAWNWPPRQVAAITGQLTAGETPAANTHPALAALAAIEGLANMRALHRKRGVSDVISQATAADLALWIREYHRRKGTWGLAETSWLRHHLAGRLFRLGRLQFMPAACGFPSLLPTDPVRAGDSVLEVHIPADSPLRPADCLAAFKAAAVFFTHEHWLGFTCESWLLSPQLNELLPKESNILAFQQFFTPLSHYMDDRQMIERVFGCFPLNMATAPQVTALQRAVLIYYNAGKQLQGAAGFRPRYSNADNKKI